MKLIEKINKQLADLSLDEKLPQQVLKNVSSGYITRLGNNLARHGYSLEKVDFTKPVRIKSDKDARLNNEKLIKIFMIPTKDGKDHVLHAFTKDGEVLDEYDNELRQSSVVSPTKTKTTKRMSLRRFKMAGLLEIAKKIWVVDTSTISTTDKQKRRQEPKPTKRYGVGDMVVGNVGDILPSRNVDKSGYLMNPNKYTNLLTNIKAEIEYNELGSDRLKKLPAILTQYESLVAEYRDSIQTYIRLPMIKRPTNTRYGSVASDLINAHAYVYRIAYKDIPRALNLGLNKANNLIGKGKIEAGQDLKKKLFIDTVVMYEKQIKSNISRLEAARRQIEVKPDTNINFTDGTVSLIRAHAPAHSIFASLSAAKQMHDELSGHLANKFDKIGSVDSTHGIDSSAFIRNVHMLENLKIAVLAAVSNVSSGIREASLGKRDKALADADAQLKKTVANAEDALYA